MTEKQKIFADEYLIDLNATRAYKVAYPRVKNDEVAAAAAARLLRNVKVAAYISERMQERQKRTEVTQDRDNRGTGCYCLCESYGFRPNCKWQCGPDGYSRSDGEPDQGYCRD